MTRLSAYVGIPEASMRSRRDTLRALASSRRRKKADIALSASANSITNAQLLYIFSRGSRVRNIPARPTLEPAIEANAKSIGRELASASQSMLSGSRDAGVTFMKRAAMAGRNAARGWFHDKRNGWPPNAPATIKAKGSDVPGIDTGAMRNAIDGIVRDE